MTHAQDPEKYLYFSVGLLRGSLALNALWQDALKYHMVDQPGQLIAMRLTEYYEALARENARSVADGRTSTIPLAPLPSSMLSPLLKEAAGEATSPPKIVTPGHGQNEVTHILKHPGTEVTSQSGSTVDSLSETPSLPLDDYVVRHANNEIKGGEIGLVRPQSESAISSQEGSSHAEEQKNTEVFASSAGAEQNAQAAADYWTML